MENFSVVNWLAVIVGTIVSFLLGWLWYSPKLFGVKWAEGSKVQLDSANKMPVFAMATQLISLFLLSLIIGLTAVANALLLAIIAILSAASFVAASSGFTQKTAYAIATEFFYIVLVGILMIIFQGIL